MKRALQDQVKKCYGEKNEDGGGGSSTSAPEAKRPKPSAANPGVLVIEKLLLAKLDGGQLKTFEDYLHFKKVNRAWEYALVQLEKGYSAAGRRNGAGFWKKFSLKCFPNIEELPPDLEEDVKERGENEQAMWFEHVKRTWRWMQRTKVYFVPEDEFYDRDTERSPQVITIGDMNVTYTGKVGDTPEGEDWIDIWSQDEATGAYYVSDLLREKVAEGQEVCKWSIVYQGDHGTWTPLSSIAAMDGWGDFRDGANVSIKGFDELVSEDPVYEYNGYIRESQAHEWLDIPADSSWYIWELDYTHTGAFSITLNWSLLTRELASRCAEYFS
jgi:hypothetical protein